MASNLSENFIEIVDRRGVVSERVSLTKDSIIIGRSYECEVIVDDPYVCPQHIKVSLLDNNELLIEDMGSLNGLAIERHGKKVKKLQLSAGESFYIGWMKIKFLSRSNQVVPARPDSSRHAVWGAFQQPAYVSIIITLPFLLLIFNDWLEKVSEFEFYSVLIAPASVYMVLILWAAVWAIVGKLFVHRAMFFTHLAIVAAVAGVSTVVDGFTSYSAFVFEIDSLKIYIDYVTSFIVITAMLYAHLHFSSRVKPRKQFFSAIIVSAVVLLVSAYVIIENDKTFSSSPRYTATIKPPVFVMGSVQSTEKFYSDIGEIEQEILKERVSKE